MTTPGLTVKGVPITPTQQSTAQTLITLGQNLNAPTVAREACIFDAIFESNLGTKAAWGYQTYGGVLGGSKLIFAKYGTEFSVNVTNLMTRTFYTGGSGFQDGGAIAAAAKYSDPSLLGPQITAPFDAKDPPPYGQYIHQGGLALIQQVKAEAIAIVTNTPVGIIGGGVYGLGGTGTSANQPATSLWIVGDSSNPDQDYWTTFNQYAQDAQLYAFSDAETMFLADGYLLMAQTPAAYINLWDPAVISDDDTYDNTAFNYTHTSVLKGKVQRRAALTKIVSPTEIELQVICDIDKFRGGDTVYLKWFGVSDGIWLVSECVRSIFKPTSTLTLTQAMQPLNANSGLALGPLYLTGQAASKPGSGTVIRAMIREAGQINTQALPYVWGGGHARAGYADTGTSASAPAGTWNGSTIGFDCSGAVGAVLAAGGLLPWGQRVPSDSGIIQALQTGALLPGQGTGNPEVTLFDNPGSHIYMRINGHYWGTWAGAFPGNANKTGGLAYGSGGGFIPNGSALPGYNAYHIPVGELGRQVSGADTGTD